MTDRRGDCLFCGRKGVRLNSIRKKECERCYQKKHPETYLNKNRIKSFAYSDAEAGRCVLTALKPYRSSSA